MPGASAGWYATAALAAVLLVFLIWGYGLRASLQRRLQVAKRRLDLLEHIAPLMGRSVQSAPAACARTAEVFRELVSARLVLCFFVRDTKLGTDGALSTDGPLVLGAKWGEQLVDFLREGELYAGATIVDWVRDQGVPAVCGPAPTPLAARVGMVDLRADPEANARSIGPLAGSRDRVWAVALPLLQAAGYVARPQVLGVVYAERKRTEPFDDHDLATAVTVARLGSDAMHRALFADRVQRESTRDHLTGLLTPAAFRERLRKEIDARRYASNGANRNVSLFFIDTDNFKHCNDTLGHAAGDRVLQSLAATFEAAARTGDGFAGRNGGDEFCIALFGYTKDAAVAAAESLRAKIESSNFLGSSLAAQLVRGTITVSIGVAHYPTDVQSDDLRPAENLLESADARMYDAKREGRNRVSFSRASVRR